ncbi:uncharacterized protein si:ch211-183d21.1 [Brienomyrus brachyistius]|uniref:uncharacterized protein si:ch211-183d21.1 n=1 Tax=Brienomyrus brachyistius TaxID=42636 RepID=UPI0020B2FE0D|nr:uncharacterized protein si:ch211-183d21.1 [Brienomyrus brachyistius]
MAVFLVGFVALLLVVPVISESCLIISEVNADNPKLDTTEFVELYHTSGKAASLDGYTLVFYNGNGNVAYKVLNLSSHTTDSRGFFLVGSADVQPKPAIILPPNTVQNGPDAIVLYQGDAERYSEKMTITTVGLMDAIVYSTRQSTDAESMADILTPGSPAFIEDDSVHKSDESMERCWLSSGSGTFQVGLPSPGQHNQCQSPNGTAVQISELRLGEGQTEGFVELSISKPGDPLVLVFLDGRTATVTFSMDINALNEGFLLITSKGSGLKGDLMFSSGNLSILKPQAASSGALAVYAGRATDFTIGSAVSPLEPLDSFVYAGPDATPSPNLTETLIPGRDAFQLSSSVELGGITLSRCGAASWSRDPGVFIKTVQTPGKPNHCLWPESCPKKSVSPEGTASPPPWDPASQQDFLLNEVNADIPGAEEDAEFIEIWHPTGRRMSLEGIWLLLFNGHNSRPYREISLTGYYTDPRGYFLVGSDGLVPKPSIQLPPNTIQNGPDAVALYRSTRGPSSTLSLGIPTEGLLDAVVYRRPGSDKEARDLSDALTPGQLPLLEDPTIHMEDESLNRCNSLRPFDLLSFVVTSPTPLQKNVCPDPPVGVVINEISSTEWSNHSQQQNFVELHAPPMTKLQGLVLVVFEEGHGGETLAVPLTGSADQDGYYLIGNGSNADQAWPPRRYGTAVPGRGAVALCYSSLRYSKVCQPETNSSIVDAVAFTQDQKLLSVLAASSGQQVMPALRSAEGPLSLSRCSCCEARTPLVWTTSIQTPHLSNLCPSSNFSSSVALCLGPPGSDGEQHSINCSGWRKDNSSRREVEVAVYLENWCHCGISALHLREVNISCVEGWLSVQGSIRALSVRQRDLILQMSREYRSQALGEGCSNHIVDKSVGERSALGWQIGLVVGTLLLLGLGAALFAYFYKKRQPRDYFSMELNENEEEPDQL